MAGESIFKGVAKDLERLVALCRNADAYADAGTTASRWLAELEAGISELKGFLSQAQTAHSRVARAAQQLALVTDQNSRQFAARVVDMGREVDGTLKRVREEMTWDTQRNNR